MQPINSGPRLGTPMTLVSAWPRDEIFRRVRTMSSSEIRKRADDILLLLRSRWPDVRIAAIEALGRAQMHGAELRQAATRETNEVALATLCDALMDLGDERSIPLLKRLARGHRSALVRRNATWAVSELLGKSSVAFLHSRERVETSVRVKAMIRAALVKNGDRRTLPALLKMLRSSDYIVRASVANFFAQNVPARQHDRDLAAQHLRSALDVEETPPASEALAEAQTRLVRRNAKGSKKH